MNRRQTLLQFNSGCWHGCFVRLDGAGREQQRFPTSLEVRDAAGLIQATLTYGHTGRSQSMNFLEPPGTMQLSELGHWSLGPAHVGPMPWVAELCVVAGDQRRRLIARHGSNSIDTIVYVRESMQPEGVAPAAEPLPVRITARGELQIWQLDDDVELLVDPRTRPWDQGSVSGMRWHHPSRGVLQVVRRYGLGGALSPMDPSW